MVGVTNGGGRTITFLFTDLEGSTEAWEADPATMADAMRRHDARIAEVLDAHDGQLAKHTGDGVMATFTSPTAAVVAAVALQHALDDLPVRTRMGIHLGEAEARDGDFFGPEVNRAARVMGIAHGGQVLVSEAVRTIVTDSGRRGAPSTDTESSVEFRHLGAHRLKGIFRPETIYQVVAPGLVTDFPPPTSLNATLGNLPTAMRLIGRRDELAELAVTLADEPVVALIGPGGVGKTSLAIAAARGDEANNPDGSWFVDLTNTDGGGVVVAVAEALGISGVPTAELDAALLEFLRARRLRLVFDNCEQVADDVARLIDQIRLHAPDVRVLATSRVRIGVSGVRSIGVRPLDTTSIDGAAVELFMRRAEEARPGIILDDEIDAIGEICAALDGLPLAIELAATRVSVLSPSDLLKRLDQRFALLRSRESQSRTLLATLEWSFELLGADDRDLFVRLGAFHSPFDLAGAVAVAPDHLDEFDLLEMIGRLVDSSLLSVETVANTTLYRRLVSVREFASLKLAEAPFAAEIAARHCAAIEEFALGLEAELLSDRCRDALSVVSTRLRDIQLAIEHAVAHEPRAVVGLIERLRTALFLYIPPSRVVAWIDAAVTELRTHGDSVDTVALLGQGADAAWRDGDHVRSGDWAAESLAMADRLGVEPDGLALLRQATIHVLGGEGPPAIELCDIVVRQADADRSLDGHLLGAAGVLVALSGQPERGVALLERALDASRREGPYRLITAIINLNLATPHADPDLRIERATEAIAGARLLGSRFHEGVAVRSLALAHLDRGDPEARAALFDAILLARDTGQRAGLVSLLEIYATEVRHDAPVDAAALLAGAGLHREQLGIPSTPREAERRAAIEDEIQSLLGDGYERACRRGQGCSIDELVEQAAGVHESVEAHDAPAPSGRLDDR